MTLHIDIASFDEACDILTDDCGDVSLLISIGEKHDALPAGFHNVRERIRLLFADTLDPETGATEADVRRIIDAARALDGTAARVVVHCAAGISRSTAAAVILYAASLGPGREDEAVSRVFEQRPFARPNLLMMEIADRLLGRGGRLFAAVASRVTDDRSA